MTLGRQRFSLAHEFYHLFYDNNMRTICAKQIGSGNETERKADVFAAYFLMPCVALMDKADSLLAKHADHTHRINHTDHTDKLTIQDIIRIEQYFGVSHQAAVYQLNNCGQGRYIDKNEFDAILNTGVRKEAEKMGFDSALYRPLPEKKQYCTYGYYIDQADQLLNKGIISDGKYEELLLAAFRDDLVYGIEEGGEVID